MTTQILAGKVALVTGGSRGIGAASALALADEGANVAISYVASADKAEAVVAQLKAKGVQARAFRADQALPAAVEQLVASAVGVDRTRGDSVTVLLLPMSAAAAPTLAAVTTPAPSPITKPSRSLS